MAAPSQSDDSIARYEGYRRADPGNARLLLTLGDLYHEAGRFEEALATFGDAAAAAPGQAAARSRIASVFISLHRFEDAEATLRPLADEQPDDPALCRNLGLALYHQSKFEAARDAFARAVEHGGKADAVDSENWLYLAYASHHLGDMESARRAADRCAELAPSPRVEGYLSLVQFDSLDHQSAYRHARSALDADADNVAASIVSGVEALECSDIDRAERLYTNASTLESSNPRAWLGVALVRLYKQEHARAVEAFERSLAFDAKNTGTLVALGWAHLTAQNYLEAHRAFERAIEVDRNFAEAHGGLAAALVMQNRGEEARREIELAHRLAPQGFGAVYAQAALLGLEGKTEVGTRLLDRAMQRSVRPGMPTLHEQVRLFMHKRQPPRLPERRR